MGQGKYRSDLLKLWKGKCPISMIDLSQVLRASHIKPWRSCSRKEKIDPNNGILLSAIYDALFDQYLITFKDTGEIRISNKISAERRPGLQLLKLRRVTFNAKQKEFLAHHRKEFEAREQNIARG